MSGLKHIEQNVKDAFISGEPGTTGREPFEDSSASGPGQRFASGEGAPGTGLGQEHGLAGTHHNHHHQHQHEHQHGAVDALTAGSGHAHNAGAPSAGYGDKIDQSLAGHGTQYGAGKHGTTGVPVGTGAGSGVGEGLGGGMTGAHGHRDTNDRVGHVGQESAKYEGDLHSGPRTGGAAGTDRFDSDRTGVAGGVGSGLDRQYDDGVEQDTSQRAPGQKSGGLSGLLATSDKDFTGRERQGKGAYADTDGPYEKNETGPAGNSALTGREGNLENNPVAQAKSRDPSSASATNEHPHGEHGKEGEHKGFMQKVKDAIM